MPAMKGICTPYGSKGIFEVWANKRLHKASLSASKSFIKLSVTACDREDVYFPMQCFVVLWFQDICHIYGDSINFQNTQGHNSAFFFFKSHLLKLLSKYIDLACKEDNLMGHLLWSSAEHGAINVIEEMGGCLGSGNNQG